MTTKHEFDEVELFLDDEEGMDVESAHSKSDGSFQEDESNEAGKDEVQDESFLLMQEAIVEDPREDYEALLPPAPCRKRRHKSWRAPRRVSPEALTGMEVDQTCISSHGDLRKHLQYLAKSLRKSQLSRKLIRRQLPQIAGQRYSFEYKSDEDARNHNKLPCASASFSVEDSRRTLLELLEGQQWEETPQRT